jgi:hypothetical protein
MSTVIVAFYDENGDPLAGLAPTFDVYKTLAGVNIAVQPAVSDIGGGLYSFIPATSDLATTGVAYILDGGPTAVPRYWSDGIGSGTVPGASSFLLNANALALLTDLQGDVPGLSDDLAARLINAASDLIEGYCNRKFKRIVGTIEKLPGHGTSRLVLARTPIESVASVVFDGATVDATSYALEDVDSGFLYKETGWEWTAKVVDAAGPFQLPSSEERLFVVTFTGGYHLPNDGALPGGATPLPSVVREACLMVATALAKMRGRDTSIQAESLGNASVQYGGGVAGRSAVGQGVRLMLAPYVRVA